MPENTSSDHKIIERTLDSVLESADEAEQLAVEAAGRIGFPEEELHKIGMAVRESVVNAVVLGNRYNARKKVQLSVCESEGCLTVTVSDEGEGFDVGSLPDPLAEHNLLQQSGRGICLMRTFMDKFEVRRLARGTEVKLIKCLEGKR